MKRTREDFNQRKQEVERYFDFLLHLDKDNPVLNYSEKEVSKNLKIDTELLKIIKANGFLLIYNLTESCCRNACVEILSAIQKKKLTYEKLTEQSQKVWIQHKTKKEKNSSFHPLAKSIIENQLIEFEDFLNTLLDDGKEYDKDKDFLGISGNIDARKMRALASNYGFSADVGEAKKGEDTLLLIKQMRNKLAHGRLTFTESVKGLSVSDMIRYKNETVAYLEGFLNNIEAHIKTDGFKVPKKATVTKPKKATQ